MTWKALTLALASAGCNQILGIHGASSDDWDGASGTAAPPPSTPTFSGAESGATSAFATPTPTTTATATDIPPPTDAGTTAYAWADWPMPNPPSPGLPNAQSYDAAASETVFDNVTELTWQQPIANQTFAWRDALAYCATLTTSGGGWRLPSRIELLSLVDFTVVPTINASAFPGTPMDGFWSGSLLAGDASFAWVVNFGFTVTPSYRYPINSTFHVRCVR